MEKPEVISYAIAGAINLCICMLYVVQGEALLAVLFCLSSVCFFLCSIANTDD